MGRVSFLAHHVVELGQAHLHARIFRFDFEQAVQHFDRFRRAVGLQMRFGDLQEQRARFAQHALLNVEVGEPFERREFGGASLAIFL